MLFFTTWLFFVWKVPAGFFIHFTFYSSFSSWQRQLAQPRTQALFFARYCNSLETLDVVFRVSATHQPFYFFSFLFRFFLHCLCSTCLLLLHKMTNVKRPGYYFVYVHQVKIQSYPGGNLRRSHLYSDIVTPQKKNTLNM